MKRFGIIATTVALAILATSAVASAQMGVAVMWQGSGVNPIFALPITVGDALCIQPMAGINWASSKGPDGGGSDIFLGGSLEAQIGKGGVGETKGLFGGKIMVDIGSPKNMDSYTDFSIGAFLGGSAKLVEGVSIVGQWGPTLTMIGKRVRNNVTLSDSYTRVDSDASITLRWWIFGK